MLAHLATRRQEKTGMTLNSATSHHFHVSVISSGTGTKTGRVIGERAHGQRANNEAIAEGHRLMRVVPRVCELQCKKNPFKIVGTGTARIIALSRRDKCPRAETTGNTLRMMKLPFTRTAIT